MNIVEFINEMGNNDLLCNPRARYTEKQQKITSGIFRALKTFREKKFRDATDEEFQQIGREVEKAYNKAVFEKHKTTIRRSMAAAM